MTGIRCGSLESVLQIFRVSDNQLIDAGANNNEASKKLAESKQIVDLDV